MIVCGFVGLIVMLLKREKILMLFSEGSIKFLTVFIILFMIISFSSIVYADNKAKAISEGLRFLEYIMIFYFIVILCDSKTIDRSFKLFYIIMLIASCYGVLQFVFKWPSDYSAGGLLGRGRIFATFVNPNYWGAAINLVIFYPLINLFERKNKNNIYDIIALAIFFFNLFFSSTRGSWLGFVLGVFTLGLIKYRKQATYALGIIFAMLLLPITRTRFLDLFNVTERFNLWKTGIYMFKDNFWFGVGNGNYISEYRNYVVIKHKELYLGKKEFSVHNSYLKMLAELGIFGGITFTIIYMSIFYISFRIYKESIKYKQYALAFLGFGVSYLFQNFSNNLIFIPQLNVFTWILCAMLYKGYKLEKSS